MQVVVKNGNVERAMRTLKKLQKEGLLKELKQRQFFEKPSISGCKKIPKKSQEETRKTWVLTNVS